jgi:hypothetical protein
MPNTLITNKKISVTSYKNTLIQFNKNSKNKIFTSSLSQNISINDCLKFKIILNAYYSLHNNVVYYIDDIFNAFQTKTIYEINLLYNEEIFNNLILEVFTIKNNLINNYNYNNFYYLDIFINNYIQSIYNILNTIRYILNFLKNYDDKAKCCEILNDLDLLKDYLIKLKKKQHTTLNPMVASSFAVTLKPEINLYVQRHSWPENNVFLPDLLAQCLNDIQNGIFE